MMLEVADLDLFYGDAQALERVSLALAAGEIVAIVGANGAGKSSLIRSIFGMEKPGAGRSVSRDATSSVCRPITSRISASARSPRAARSSPA